MAIMKICMIKKKVISNMSHWFIMLTLSKALLANLLLVQLHRASCQVQREEKGETWIKKAWFSLPEMHQNTETTSICAASVEQTIAKLTSRIMQTLCLKVELSLKIQLKNLFKSNPLSCKALGNLKESNCIKLITQTIIQESSLPLSLKDLIQN